MRAKLLHLLLDKQEGVITIRILIILAEVYLYLRVLNFILLQNNRMKDTASNMCITYVRRPWNSKYTVKLCIRYYTRPVCRIYNIF
jgi:hypothetical protein